MKIVYSTFIISFVLFFSACASKSYASNYDELTEVRVDDEKLYISGIINKRTYFDVKDILEDNPQLEVVVLDDIDGSIDDEMNLRVSLLIHDARLDTFVPRGSEIYSGAVDMFCAGKNRVVQEGAKIGVHSWGDDEISGDRLPRSAREHDMYLDYFEEVGCPKSFYWFTLEAAEPDDIYIMSEDELLEEGVATDIID